MADQAPTRHAATSDTAIGEPGAERLSLPVIWAFSLPRIAFGIMGSLFAIYLMKFSTDVLLIAPGIMGTILAASRLWDGVSDPVVGYLSDNANSRFGRRRVWMFFAAVPMGASMFMMWSPPLDVTGTWLVIWMGAALLIYETSSTGFFVPHGALGVELTPNYHERTRLFGYGHMIGAIGTILGLAALQLMNMADDKRSFAFGLSLVAGVTVTLVVLWSTRILPERADYQGRGTKNLYKSFADVFRNPHSRLLLIVFGIETFGAASLGLLVPYVFEYVMHAPELMVAILVIYTVPQVAFTPMWIKLSGIFGKKRIWLFSMWVSAFCFFAFFLVTDPGPLAWVLAFMLGFAGGCGAVVAPAIKADVIDYDEYLTGERKEGAYLAVWNMIRKSAGSLTALITGLALQFSGFVPNVEQTDEVLLVIRGVFAFLPGVCYVIGTLLFMRFGFNEAEHAEVRRELEARASATRSSKT